MIHAFINEVEEVISSSSIVISSNIQKYFGSSKNEAYIRGNLIFINLSSLEFAIYLMEKGKRIIFDKYRFQYMDYKEKHIFRYDNAPHYKNILTFPDHKHLMDGKIIESTTPSFNKILEEITALIGQSTS